MKMKPFGKKIMAAVLILSAAAGCGKAASDPAAEPAPKAEAEGKTAAEAGNAAGEKEQVVILTAAAASLKYSFDEKLIPLFEEKYPWITVEASYDSSGKLQSQIEEGLAADVFMSAAEKQMDALAEEGLIDEESRADILENKIVLIVPETEENPGEITSFEDIVKAELIAVGDPESVPAGQYGKEVLESMGLWEEVSRKASYGTNVTEV